MGRFGSFEELVAADARWLDDASLKAALVEFERVQARLDAARAVAVGELDARVAYVADGAVNAKAWLAHHTGVSRTAAGARVRTARLWRRMPLFAAALAGGRICEGHLRSAGRGVNPRTVAAFAAGEALLVEWAGEFGVDDFDGLVTRWLAVHDPDGADPGGTMRDSHAHVSRTLGGRVRVDADLSVGDGEEFRAELDALADEEYHADHTAGVTRSRAQRLGAAMAEMARRSSATRPTTTDDDDAVIVAAAPRRPQLVVITPLDALLGEPGVVATLEDGAPIPPEVLDRWACDTHIARVVMAGASVPVNLGRLTRTPSAAQRRALIARDHGCIVEGCCRPARWCQAHHVRHWTRAGPTDIDNLALVCTRHHTLIHQPHPPITLRWDTHSGRWHAVRPDGTPLTPLRHQPPPPATTAA